MKFHRAGLNLIVILAICLIGLFGDLYLFALGEPTISEAIWTVNQHSLAVAVGLGVIIGHLFTVPK